MLGLLVDQDTSVQGVWVPFFGRPAFSPRGAGRPGAPDRRAHPGRDQPPQGRAAGGRPPLRDRRDPLRPEAGRQGGRGAADHRRLPGGARGRHPAPPGRLGLDARALENSGEISKPCARRLGMKKSAMVHGTWGRMGLREATFVILFLAAGCRPVRPGEARQVAPELTMDGVQFQIDRGGVLTASGEAERLTYRRDTTDVAATALAMDLLTATGLVHVTAPNGSGTPRRPALPGLGRAPGQPRGRRGHHRQRHHPSGPRRHHPASRGTSRSSWTDPATG